MGASEVKRRCRRGENVAPAEASQVERREAPHPYVTGVRAPSHGARRTLARSARVPRQAPGASRRSMSLVRGRRKTGKGDARRPKIQSRPGGVALASRAV